jgi:hypothetical protein
LLQQNASLLGIRTSWHCAGEFRLEDHRWLSDSSLHGPRTPTIVGEIHVIPARWKKITDVLQKTGMDCRDGRNSKRLTFSICVRSTKCEKFCLDSVMQASPFCSSRP